jgi:hypothetical protein
LAIGVAGYQRADRSAVNPEEGFARSAQHGDREKVLVHSPRTTPTLRNVTGPQNEPCLSFCPIRSLGKVPQKWPKSSLVVSWTHDPRFVMPAVWLWYLNMSDAVILLFIVAVLVILFIHHYLFWPTILRPLYALQRYGAKTNKKLIGSLGCALVLWAILYNSTSLHVVFEAMLKKAVGS